MVQIVDNIFVLLEIIIGLLWMTLSGIAYIIATTKGIKPGSWAFVVFLLPPLIFVLMAKKPATPPI